MANTEIINEIISMTADFLTYMLPVLAIMTGITFIMSFLYEATIGVARKTFRG